MNVNNEIWPIVTLALALLLTILTCIFIVPERKRAKLGKFGRFLHDTVNFKYLIVEKLLQFLYILATVTVIVAGIIMLFAYEERYYGYRYYSVSKEWIGYYGLVMIVAGPIAIRLAYEFLMMAILLIKNVIQINNKLQAPAEAVKPTEEKRVYTAPVYEAPVYEAPAEEPAQGWTCQTCGAKVAAGKFCPVCGTKAD